MSSYALRFVSLALTLLVFSPAASRAEEDKLPYRQQQDVVFAQVHGVVVTMDIFAPTAAEKNGLGIIDVVSGAWSSDRGKIRDHKRARMYDIFCGRGYTVFAIRPGSVSRFSNADMVDHIESGIRWIKERSEEYNVDPLRLGLTGASAGGHLAALVAVRNDQKPDAENCAVSAAGVFFPITDFIEFGSISIDPRAHDSIGQLVRALAFPNGMDGLSEEKITAGLRAISPAHQVTANAPPFLLIHGDADMFVPLQQSQRLMTELKNKKVPVELIVKEGGAHPWPTIHEEVSKLADWFDRQLTP